MHRRDLLKFLQSGLVATAAASFVIFIVGGSVYTYKLGVAQRNEQAQRELAEANLALMSLGESHCASSASANHASTWERTSACRRLKSSSVSLPITRMAAVPE